jgi:hypothetical protein
MAVSISTYYRQLMSDSVRTNVASIRLYQGSTRVLIGTPDIIQHTAYSWTAQLNLAGSDLVGVAISKAELRDSDGTIIITKTVDAPKTKGSEAVTIAMRLNF